VASVPMYLGVVAEANRLTGSHAIASFKDHGTRDAGRLARLYLARTGHDLGGIYLFHDVPPVTGCDRYQRSWLYLTDAVGEWTLGASPDWPVLSGTQGKIDEANAKLAAHGCTTPAARPLLDGDGTTPPPADHAQHTYAGAGNYTARVTVSDGHATAT